MSSNIDSKINEIKKIDELQQRDIWINKLHPVVKLIVVVAYSVLVVSVDKYNLALMILMSIFPLITFMIADLKYKQAFQRMKVVLILVIGVGIFNPMLDRELIGYVGKIPITTGMISMLTLILKGIYTVIMAYILIATTCIEDICYALRLIKVPKVLVTLILLIYRYIFIMIEEASKMMMSYKLRAPKQRGIHYRVWGPLVGQWLLRSMDRAENVYESMQLRGFDGEFYYSRNRDGNKK